MKTQFIDGTEYTTYGPFKGSGGKFTVMVVKGKYNYISVTKITNNPFGGRLGKDFKDFDSAVKFYKDKNIKTALLKIETGLPLGSFIKGRPNNKYNNNHTC